MHRAIYSLLPLPPFKSSMARSIISADRGPAASAPDANVRLARRTFAINSIHPRPLRFQRTDEHNSQDEQLHGMAAADKALRMQTELSRCVRAPGPACAAKHARCPSPRRLANPRLVRRAVCARSRLEPPGFSDFGGSRGSSGVLGAAGVLGGSRLGLLGSRVFGVLRGSQGSSDLLGPGPGSEGFL